MEDGIGKTGLNYNQLRALNGGTLSRLSAGKSVNISAPVKTGLHSKDRTTSHNEAVAAARNVITAQATKKGMKGDFLPGGPIDKSSKKNLYKGAGASKYPGYADIVWQDNKTKKIYVWEVKSKSEQSKARKEAEWYVKNLKAENPQNSYGLGWNIDGPWYYDEKKYILGIDDGAIIYDRDRNRRRRQKTTASTTASRSASNSASSPSVDLALSGLAGAGSEVQRELARQQEASRSVEVENPLQYILCLLVTGA